MTDKILSILNPVHLLTVDEWRKIADIICPPHGDHAAEIQMINIIHCISRFEELTRGKWIECDCRNGCEKCNDIGLIWQPALLKKEMFVCEVKEPHWKDYPKLAGFDSKKLEDATIKYTQAQAKVWFEGFYKAASDGAAVLKTQPGFAVKWMTATEFVWIENKRIYSPTVFDFIIELERYNKSTKEPIKINWTENFVKELVK